jgi:hypothetical protein
MRLNCPCQAKVDVPFATGMIKGAEGTALLESNRSAGTRPKTGQTTFHTPAQINPTAPCHPSVRRL